MKPPARKILAGIAVLAIGIQFIRPARNVSSAPAGPGDITVLHPTPLEVKTILARACNDCHSDNTRYPWYASVQPAGWWLANHVSDGKRHLNFSQFGTYAPDRATHKIEELIEEVEARQMPLPSYTRLHPDAKLSDAEIAALVTWARAIEARLAAP